MGAPSGGGSPRVIETRLPNGRIHVRLASMASFKPDGHLYEDRGTAPEVLLGIVPTDLIGKTDTVLTAAIQRFNASQSTLR